MSLDPVDRVCGNCDAPCFEPQPCVACKGKPLCSDCRLRCEECEDTFCLDDMADSRICKRCARAEAIVSGQAMADWKWGRDY